MLDKIMMYLQYPFVQYAIIVGVLIALCSSLLGVVLVLKRFSFIGDGLSHIAFLVMIIATILKLSNINILTMPVTIISAILLLHFNQKTRINGDAILAVISVSSLALGYLTVNIFSHSANVSGDVCSTLFGSTSILTLSKADVWMCSILSTMVILFFVLFYNKIFAITFDDKFAKAVGTPVQTYNIIIATFIAVIIVLAMNLVGSLLITALIIFPALSAMRVFKSFLSVTISSAILSVITSLMGIIFSIIMGTPVGSTVVAMQLIVFLIFTLIGVIKR